MSKPTPGAKKIASQIASRTEWTREELETRLTPAQRAFCVDYLRCNVASEAARNAGYSKSMQNEAYKMLRKPEIKAYLDHLRLDAINRGLMPPEEIMLQVQQIAVNAMKEGRNSEALKALELMGRFHDMWSDKNKSTVDINVNTSLRTGQDEEAAARDAARFAAVAAPKLKLVTT